MEQRRLVYGTLGGILLALVAAVVLFGFLFCGVLFGEGKAIVYRIPADFSGWVVVKFDVPSCPPLEEDKNAIYVQVGMNGEVCTSHPLFQGWKKAKYLQMKAGGTADILPYGSWDKSKDRIWSVTLGYVSYTREGKSFSVPREVFFVGTKEQLERAWSKQPPLE